MAKKKKKSRIKLKTKINIISTIRCERIWKKINWKLELANYTLDEVAHEI